MALNLRRGGIKLFETGGMILLFRALKSALSAVQYKRS